MSLPEIEAGNEMKRSNANMKEVEKTTEDEFVCFFGRAAVFGWERLVR